MYSLSNCKPLCAISNLVAVGEFQDITFVVVSPSNFEDLRDVTGIRLSKCGFLPHGLTGLDNLVNELILFHSPSAIVNLAHHTRLIA